MFVTENQLDEWVRFNAREAQGVIVELVWRLVAASAPRPRLRRFPLGDSVGQQGPDGELDIELSYDPFVPAGHSYWEIGTGIDPASKATRDYADLVKSLTPAERKDATFVFVTPLSGTRGWKADSKVGGQTRWLSRRQKSKKWKDVRVVDGAKLVDWMRQFPSVGLWMLGKILRQTMPGLEIPEQHWDLVRGIGEPPPLTPELFLSNRDEAVARLAAVFEGSATRLRLGTRFPAQIIDFVAAFLAGLSEEDRVERVGRCLFVSDERAWSEVTALPERLVLVADGGLDLSDSSGTLLLEKAKRRGHSVIFGGLPGGLPDPLGVSLYAPTIQQVRDALEHAGHNEERARTLANKSNGDLSSLLRCLQNLSQMPEWAQRTSAGDLAVAAMLGSWNESVIGDHSIIENVSGKPFGEWIGRIREASRSPGTPLSVRDGQWRFVSRYEGWNWLGAHIYDAQLDRLQVSIVSALRVSDPRLEFPRDERLLARIDGPKVPYSRPIRTGLAEAVALLGSHPRALTHCSAGKAELTAVLAVRGILTDADWKVWSSLHELLALLAEGAPGEFLSCVERALQSTPCPFDDLFAQEDGGMLGQSHISGLLWSLETLAWDESVLMRVVSALGELAKRDPGGRFTNRPANSLATILLPWLPQTCATVERRIAAVKALSHEAPLVAWKLLLSLLPGSTQTSFLTRRPTWRETLPERWSSGVPRAEFESQVQQYSSVLVDLASGHPQRLIELVEYHSRLSPQARAHLRAWLETAAIEQWSEAERTTFWNALISQAAKHRKFAEAIWAMPAADVTALEELATRFAPASPRLRHLRLFASDDWSLFSDDDNYETQAEALHKLRERAIAEIASADGLDTVIAYASEVEAPWRVGSALAGSEGDRADGLVLPSLLLSADSTYAQFAGGYVRGRFHLRGWDWVDAVDTSAWDASEIAAFLAYLPFDKPTWDRATRMLGPAESLFWSKTGANPYEATADIDIAAERLVENGRPLAAIRCLYHLIHKKEPLPAHVAVRALLAVGDSEESRPGLDAHEISEVIQALQESRNADPDELSRVEWAFLPLLDGHHRGTPQTLERRLAADPAFFCEAVRLGFRSRNDDGEETATSDQKRSLATGAYRLLSEWRLPPGMLADGSVDAPLFNDWLTRMRSECEESGHLEIAFLMFGKVLTHVPPDADGLWIDRTVAAALNAKDAEEMRNGFRTALYNARGVHWVDPSGAQERGLAEYFRERAGRADDAGFTRLAATVRELAESYDREAESIAHRYEADI